MLLLLQKMSFTNKLFTIKFSIRIDIVIFGMYYLKYKILIISTGIIPILREDLIQ